MDKLIYLIYPALIFVIFWKSKPFGLKKWNDEFLSLRQTKAMQGLSAICILLHHCSQKLCSPDTKEIYYKEGLEPFVFLGYFCVAIFFFCSGYGLYKSFRTKNNYLKEFPSRKLLPVIYSLILSSFLFLL